MTGVSNHAGTTPMRLRRDAGYLAASVNVFVRGLAREMAGDQVGTVGALSLRPNLINVVPNRAVFTVDLRNTDEAKLKEAERVSRPTSPRSLPPSVSRSKPRCWRASSR